MAEPTWIPLRRYAELRGVTADALLKAIKRGRLDVPHRRSNADGRGSFEVLVSLAELTPPPAAPPVPDRSATPDPHPLQAELEAVQAHLAAVVGERDRLLVERDQERHRLEQDRATHAADVRRLQDQLEALTSRLADLAHIRVELDRLQRKGWLARLLNM
jgi:hypothetical protein